MANISRGGSGGKVGDQSLNGEETRYPEMAFERTNVGNRPCLNSYDYDQSVCWSYSIGAYVPIRCISSDPKMIATQDSNVICGAKCIGNGAAGSEDMLKFIAHLFIL